MKIFPAILLNICVALAAAGQTVGSFLPKQIGSGERYLFYQHGGVVTELGNNAVNQSVPEWGPYEYLNILDSLKSRRFNVISERRVKDVPDSVYADRIALQIDSLLDARVKAKNIIVVGASAGWNITLQVASILKNKKIKYVMMGGCWPETYKEYERVILYGRFLSIIEKTDPHGTCIRIFENRKQVKRHKEIVLTTGLSHGFIYKGYPEWIEPIIKWFEQN